MTLSYDDLLRPFSEAMKPAGDWRIGAEAEKFGVDRVTGNPCGYDGPSGVAAILKTLSQSYGWSPVSEQPGGPLIALTRNGASVTLEPGAQLELSGAPWANLHGVVSELEQHLGEVEAIAEPMGIAWLATGFHPFASQAELPWVPKQRYAIMREYLPTRGARALDMMRRTATVQANFDYASEEDAMRKLRLALKLSPLVTAMFASSPFRERAHTGGRSERAHVWLAVDPDRQGLLPALFDPRSGIRDYVEWALDAPMFLFKRDHHVVANTGQTFRTFLTDGHAGQTANMADWELHLNTLFPEVRLKHTIEVRGADSVPRQLAAALPALWTGILYDGRALAAAERIVESWTHDELTALRPVIAERALRATFRGRPLSEIAQTVIDVAKGGLARRGHARPDDGRDESVYLEPLIDLIAHGDTLADRLDREVPRDPIGFTREVIARTRA